MNKIESTARWLKYGLGLKDDSWLVVAIRPRYNKFLALLYGRHGLTRTLGGVENLRILPRHRYLHNDYEPAMLRTLRQRVCPGDTVFEVGAHVGIFTVLLARWVGPTGHVYAFEPSPHARVSLHRHLLLNGVADRVSVIPAAVSDHPGRSVFFERGTSGCNTLAGKNTRLVGARRIEVQVTTLDEFCRTRSIVPSLIKIDIEGFELHAMRGARETLRLDKPIVVLEVHPMNWTSIGITEQEFKNFVKTSGFLATGLEGQRDPFSQYGHVILEHPAEGSGAARQGVAP